MRVAIIGTGGIALGAACLLAAGGHQPVLWSPSGSGSPGLAAAGAVEASGALDGRHPVTVAPDAAAAVRGVDAVLLALPGNHHRRALEAIAPHLADGQGVLLSGHLSFGALFLSRLLADRGVRAPIAAWGTTVTTGRRTAPDAVRVNNLRKQVDVAVIPDGDTDAVLALCRALFGDRFMARDGLLAIALSNVNPQNHMAIALCNLTRMERGERWSQYGNITDAVGRLIEAMDVERLAIAGAFGVTVRTVRQHFALSFGVPEASVGAMAAAMTAQGADTAGPATLDTRYVLEDVPFGLHATVRLGELAGVPAPLHRSGVALFSALYGRDLAAENDLLPAIGFDALDAAGLRRMAKAGWG